MTNKINAALRRRAEWDSGKQDVPTPVPHTEADARRLVHELEVHRIELEMQNVELRQSRDEVELILDKYTDLYDFAPVGYFTLAADERIHLVNLTGSVLVGVERSKLIGRSFGMLISLKDRGRFKAFLKQVFANVNKQSADFELTGGHLKPRFVNLESQRSHQGAECSAVMVDITERKQAEDVLHRSEALFSTLVSQAPVGIYLVDSGLRLQQANPIAMRIFENVHPLVGRDFSAVMRTVWPRRIADQIVGHFRRTLETGEPFQSPPFSERRRDNGKKETYEWQIQRVTLPAGEFCVVCFFNNVTERMKADAAQRRIEVLAGSNLKLKQEIARRQVAQNDLRASRIEQSKILKQSRLQQIQLRELSHGVLNAQEEERKRISRELHDVIAQTLVGINVHLAALSKAAESDPADLQSHISRTQLLVEKAVEVVHNFALELRPTMLDDLGLVPALQTLMMRFMKDTGIRVSLKASAKVEKAGGAVRTALYRIVQESLTNVARHSGASRADVRIECIEGVVSMEVRDNGQGFNSNGKKHNCLGLLGMKERVEMIGGTFRVETTPGKSTAILVVVPLR